LSEAKFALSKIELSQGSMDIRIIGDGLEIIFINVSGFLKEARPLIAAGKRDAAQSILLSLISDLMVFYRLVPLIQRAIDISQIVRANGIIRIER